MSRVFIIAEAGVNHNGDIGIAKKLIDIAANVGADAIKFQTFHTDELACKNAPKAEYQKENTQINETQFDMLKKIELTEEVYRELFHYSNSKGIAFLLTPFDLSSIDLLKRLGLHIVKIPSGEITNYPYLKKVSESFDEIILSTGMSTLEEVKWAVKVLDSEKQKKITLLQCNSQYPTPVEAVNLRGMETLKKELNRPIGYSDHTLGMEIAIAAVAMGAEIIEKHFTLDKGMEGPDHKASLEPKELEAMIRAIRNIELALGNGEKRPTESEQCNIAIVRKSIVAKRDIKEGEIFTEYNITTKRPGTGLSPMRWVEVIGKAAKRQYQKDEFIEL